MTFEDEDIAHILDPETGEINKDNFVAYSLERKLLDAQVPNLPEWNKLNVPQIFMNDEGNKCKKKENEERKG